MSDDFGIVREALQNRPHTYTAPYNEAYAALARIEARVELLLETRSIQTNSLSDALLRAEAAEHDLAMERSMNKSYEEANKQALARLEQTERWAKAERAGRKEERTRADAAERALREVDRVAGEGKIGAIARAALASSEKVYGKKVSPYMDEL